MRNLLLLSFFLLSFTSIKAQWITDNVETNYGLQEYSILSNPGTSSHANCNDIACAGVLAYFSVQLSDPNGGSFTKTIPTPPSPWLTYGLLQGPFSPTLSNHLGSTIDLTITLDAVDVNDIKAGLYNGEVPIPYPTQIKKVVPFGFVYQYYHIMILFWW
ncbi:hypothetical protein ACOMSG_09885 [Macellibacteroides fermentans]|uniref:hypothetical protein n=1 Tax=Macellibacteroides fermentans TaxID=879969 RepID=UPI003B92313D